MQHKKSNQEKVLHKLTEFRKVQRDQSKEILKLLPLQERASEREREREREREI